MAALWISNNTPYTVFWAEYPAGCRNEGSFDFCDVVHACKCFNVHLWSCSRSPPLQGGPQCAAVGCGWHPALQSWGQGGWVGTRTQLWNWPSLSPNPAAALSHTKPEKNDINMVWSQTQVKKVARMEKVQMPNPKHQRFGFDIMDRLFLVLARVAFWTRLTQTEYSEMRQDAI